MMCFFYNSNFEKKGMVTFRDTKCSSVCLNRDDDVSVHTTRIPKRQNNRRALIRRDLD